MRNLSADVLALFSSLDGRDRYQDALERWGARLREYHRVYASDRYATDPQFRSRRIDATHRYKDRRFGVDRPRRTLGPIAVIHGTYLAYTKRGCRCSPCRAASAAYQRARRARLKVA